jgi:hypothetical protein
MNERGHHYGQDLLIKPGASTLTLRQELEADIARLERMIAKRREMLELLDRNQDIERFMDLSRGL